MAFEQCATTFFKTPLLTELLVQFIQRGDLATQQHIIDIGSQVHNEKKCLHYHAFAYLQCGLVNPARILFKVQYVPPFLTCLFHSIKSYLLFLFLKSLWFSILTSFD